MSRATAIYFGLRYLLLYATMHHDDMIPVLTLWPMAAMRLGLTKAKPPTQTDALAEVFHNAFLMDDMTALLVSPPPHSRCACAATAGTCSASTSKSKTR